MASLSTSTTKSPAELGPRYERIYVWQAPIRIYHWVNVLCIITLFWTGLYIATPVLAATGEPYESFVMARIRMIHFAAAYVFLAIFLMRIFWFIVGNEHARSGYPYFWRASWWRDLLRQIADYIKLDFGSPHVSHNALAGIAYTAFIGLCWAQIFTGLALYAESSPGGFWDTLVGWVRPLLGGSYRTHMWHHLFAWAFVWFAIIHIYIVILDSRQYRNGLIGSMITGMKFRRIKDD